MGCKMGSLLKKKKEEIAASPRSDMENQQLSAIELEQDNQSSQYSAIQLEQDNQSSQYSAIQLEQDNQNSQHSAIELEQDNQSLQLSAIELEQDNQSSMARRNEVIPAVNDPIICNSEEEFPDFDEGNPSEWVRSCNEYFQMHKIPENLKMDYVTLNMDDKILDWFIGYMCDHDDWVSWDEFSDDICRIFSLPRTSVEEEGDKHSEIEGEEEGDKHSETREESSLDEKLEGIGINTLKLLGKVNHKPLLILIDTGSTHSFLRPKFALDMGLQCAPTSPFQVAVASGAELKCRQICPNFKWTVQEETFEKDVMLLELNGCMCDLVLGMDWVDSFAPIQLHTRPLSISFHRGSRWVTLYGMLPGSVLKKLC